jgi:hypothetical protein
MWVKGKGAARKGLKEAGVQTCETKNRTRIEGLALGEPVTQQTSQVHGAGCMRCFCTRNDHILSRGRFGPHAIGVYEKVPRGSIRLTIDSVFICLQMVADLSKSHRL